MSTESKFIMNVRNSSEILPKNNIDISVLKCNGNSR